MENVLRIRVEGDDEESKLREMYAKLEGSVERVETSLREAAAEIKESLKQAERRFKIEGVEFDLANLNGYHVVPWTAHDGTIIDQVILNFVTPKPQADKTWRATFQFRPGS